ncbi:PREDICTED: uncharacterized protein LOC106741558 [Dinoponera quadriceps]|uniref:Uncharacterized protein LOC106741558 n=1 Tax=Dinoponera quadriceps TaxID=609295 RepID=A0A6P3WSS9_DINQU|nr:PREDICTED: uncharacterized protein LOC106741558 [Dinoponera quadriceps]
MKTYLRRPAVAVVPLLLIHLVTLRAGGATAAKYPGVKHSAPGKIILEEVIISGSGNNTRITANALAQEPSQLGREILSLLSKRETNQPRVTSDQEVGESRVVHVEDDEDELERLKRVVAKYEPQRIASRIAKRKILDAPVDIHDTPEISDRIAGSTTTGSTADLEDTYHEVLRNISRGISQLAAGNAGMTLSPSAKGLRQVPIPEVTIRTATGDGTEKPSHLDPPLSALKKKKLLLKKYTQPNRATASPPPESKPDEAAAGTDESAKGQFHVANGKPKLKNGSSTESSSSNTFPEPTEKSKKSAQERLLRVQNAFNSLQLPLKYSKVPRPFSAAATDPPRLLHAANSAAKIATSYGKPSSSPASVTRQITQPAPPAQVLPLVLPTDLFSVPPTRHYVPIKRANREFSHSDGIHTAATSFGNSPGAAGKEAAVLGRPTDRPAPYTNVIAAAKVPVKVAADGRPAHVVITENPAGSASTTYIPSPSHILQRRKEPQDVAPRTGDTLGVAYDGGSDLNANPGIALYDKFASLYSIPTANVLPKAVAQDYKSFKQPSSALPYPATPKPIPLKPISPLPIVQPLAPYFDSSLLRHAAAEQLDKGDGEVSERPRVSDEGDVADGKSALGAHRTQINHGTYEVREGAKATQEIREKEQRKQNDEDPYRQRTRDYERTEEYQGRRDEKEDDRSEDIQAEEDDEEDAGETREGEYQSNNSRANKEDEDEKRGDRFDKYGRDDSEEELRRKKQRYSVERYDGPGYNGDEESADDGEYRRDRGNEEHEDASEDELVVARRSKDQSEKQGGKYQKKRIEKDDKRKYYSHLTSPRADTHLRAQQEEYDETNPKQVREKYQHRQRVKDHQRDPEQGNGDKGHGDEEGRDHVHGETKEHAHKHEEHHDDKKHGGDHKFEAGEGGEHEKEHHSHDGEKGDKGYKVWHEHEKAAKGHHDKEHSNKEYDEKDGKEKKHEEEGGYHEEHHHGEKGEKAAEFDEKGEHQKGHSTKGEHSVHKKDEYEKKTEFFDEFHEDGGSEKHGEHHHGHESKKGGHEKKAHHDAADHEEKHGKKHKYEKGGHHHEHKGHKVHEGHDHHYDHGHKHGEKGGHERGKKWSFKKGGDGGHKHER